jgi:hypothetical protein
MGADPLAAAFGQLGQLQVVHAPRLHCSSEAWRQLAAGAPQLRQACFQALALDDAQPLPALRDLNVRGLRLEGGAAAQPEAWLARLMPCLQRLGGLWESEPGLAGWAPALAQHPELQQLQLTCSGAAVGHAQHQHQHQSEQPAWSGLQLSSCPKLRAIDLDLGACSVHGLLAELAACPRLQQLELRGFYDNAITRGDMQALARSRSLRSLKLEDQLEGASLALEALAPLLAPGACRLQLLDTSFELPGEVADEARKVMEEHFCMGTDHWRDEIFGVGGDAGRVAAAAAAMGELRRELVRAVQEGLGLGEGELQVVSLDLDCDGCDRYGAMNPLYVSLEARARGCSMKLRTSCE